MGDGFSRDELPAQVEWAPISTGVALSKNGDTAVIGGTTDNKNHSGSVWSFHR